jgi:hypothetical protein
VSARAEAEPVWVSGPPLETVDPGNERLRQWAEDLVEAHDAIAAAYDDIWERMVEIRGIRPEDYAHLYLDAKHKN